MSPHETAVLDASLKLYQAHRAWEASGYRQQEREAIYAADWVFLRAVQEWQESLKGEVCQTK